MREKYAHQLINACMSAHKMHVRQRRGKKCYAAWEQVALRCAGAGSVTLCGSKKRYAAREQEAPGQIPGAALPKHPYIDQKPYTRHMPYL